MSQSASTTVARDPWAAVALLRPRQWVKNVFVLAPLVFSMSFTDPAAVRNAAVAFLVFCAAASAGYVFNDLWDLEADRRHPVKRRTRPLASGAITPGPAWTLFAVLAGTAALGALIVPAATAVAGVYLVLSVAYSAKLKHMAVVDLFALAAGFVLRVYAGAVAIDVVLSSWMLITTLSLALYLAAVKRRDELAAGGDGRAVLAAYTVPLLTRYADWAAVSSIVFYGLFVITVRPALAVTVPFVLFGLFRYAYAVEGNGLGESPTDAVLRDPPLLLTVLAWGALCLYLLWPR